MNISSSIIDDSIRVRSRLVSLFLKEIDESGVKQDVAIVFPRDIWLAGGIGGDAAVSLTGLFFGGRCFKGQDLLMASIIPVLQLGEKFWVGAWKQYELVHCVEGNKFVEVTHTVGGVAHKHRVYSRVEKNVVWPARARVG